MTVSMDDRFENIRLALQLMLDQIGEKAVWEETFTPSEPQWQDIAKTTWLEMEDSGYVQRAVRRYRLVGLGWYKALELAGCLEDPKFEERVSTLQAALKAHVKGRQDKTWVTLDDIAREAGLPKAWVFNAIDSRLIGRLRGVTDAYWEPTSEIKNLIEIPERFSMKPLGS